MGNQSGKIIVNHRGSKFIDTDVDPKNSRTNWIAGMFISHNHAHFLSHCQVHLLYATEKKRIYLSAFFSQYILKKCKFSTWSLFLISLGVASAPGRPKIELSSRVSAPEDDSVTDEINLTWAVPEDDGGYPITGMYRVLVVSDILSALSWTIVSKECAKIPDSNLNIPRYLF